MAALLTDIIGKVLYFHDMTPIVISSEIGLPVRIIISEDAKGVIIDETYYPDFDGLINLDIRDVIASDMYLQVPEVGYDIQQKDIFRTYTIQVGNDISGVFTVCGYSEDALEFMTDVDMLRIPQNYMMPLSICNICDRIGISYRFLDGSVEDEDVLRTKESIGITARMVGISASPAADKSSFFVEIACDVVTYSSPVFHITPGHFEQYLFANRYGGFDNIPMDGLREFVPDLSFETGKYSSGNEQTSAEAEYVYSQNSGFQSRKVLELAAELLCSPQIYHLTESGRPRRIIILESSLTSSSENSLHSFSFKYKYADDTRPASLKYRTMGVMSTVAAEPQKTVVYPITMSPMTITHNRNRYPCITAVDKNRETVVVSIEYPDTNTVKISWKGDLEGYIYLN